MATHAAGGDDSPLAPLEQLPPPPVPDHEMLRRIASGSYGQVWLARNATGTYRAVKVIYRRGFERDRPYAREFEGIQKFEPISRSHSGLMDILHVGRNDLEGYFYYVMELADAAQPRNLDGLQPGAENSEKVQHAALDPATYIPRTLAYELSRCARLPLEECVRIGLSLTDALEHLHQQGLVHRDIKPSNIIFVGGVPKLADIGLVTEAGRTLSCVGTEGFIPPEGPGSPQADIYSLGKVLYEASTGKDRQDYPEPPTNLADLPEQEGLLELNEVIFKACASDARRRYPTAQAMQRDLLVVQAGRSVKRLHLLERRLTWARRFGCGIALLLLLAGSAYWQASRAQKTATQRLIRLQVANAVRRMDDGDLSGALPWITESLRMVNGDSAGEEMHRYRFESVWRQCPKLSAVCLHQNRIYEAGFSPDGRRFVTASADHTAQVWDAATGQPALPPLAHQDEVLHALYTPDGRRLVTVSRDATLRLWDAASGRPLCAPRQQKFHIACIAFSPDGTRMVTGSGALGVDLARRTVLQRELANDQQVRAPLIPGEALGEAQIFDVATGQPVGRPFRHVDAVEDANFSPDGQLIVTASDDHTAVIWNVTTGEPMAPALKHGGKVRRAVFSRDGLRVLTASEDHTAQLWDTRTGQPAGPTLHHAKGVLYAAFSPEGSRIVTVSRDQTACLWDATTGQLLCLPLRHVSDVRYAEFSPDGRWLVTAGSESVVRVWDAFRGILRACLRENNNVPFATFSPEGRRLLTVSRDRLARLWDLLPLSPGARCLQHEARVNSIQFNHSGTQVVTASDDSAGRVWDAATGTPITPALREPGDKGPSSFFRAVFSPDGQRVLTTSMHSAFASVYDAKTGEFLITMGDESGRVVSADFSAQGDRVVTANTNGTARVWEARTGRPLTGVFPHDRPVRLVVFSPDGLYIATATGDWPRLANDGDQVRVWDAKTGQLLSPVIRIQGIASALSFSPDSRRLLTAATLPPLDEREAQVWDWRIGLPAAPPLRHLDGVAFAGFSPDGRRVVTASFDKTARVWDAQTGQPLSKAMRHARQVEHVAFSPDGRRVVTACQDGTARVWDAATGEPVSLPLTHEGPVWWAEFSPDGRRVATASDDHTGRIWELSKDERPIRDLQLFAELMSGQEIDNTGSTVPMLPEELLATWRTLRAKYPADFEVSPAQAIAWDEREAEASEQAHQWFAARSHLARLMAAQPGNAEYARRRASDQLHCDAENPHHVK